MIRIEGKELAPEARQALAQALAAMTVDAQEDPLLIERVAALYEHAKGHAHAENWLLELVPREINAEQWLIWLASGPPPGVRPVLADPDRGRKPGARGAYQSAAARRDEARRVVEARERELEAARAELAEREAEVKVTDAHLRAVVLFRLNQVIAQQATGLFELGPMYTLARAISGHLREDVAFEAGLSEEQQQWLACHRETRNATAPEILELLDLYCGDVEAEVKIHVALLNVLREIHRPVNAELERRNVEAKPLSARAKRLKRRAQERRVSVRPGVPRRDRYEVLDGLRRGNEATVEEDDLGSAQTI